MKITNVPPKKFKVTTINMFDKLWCGKNEDKFNKSGNSEPYVRLPSLGGLTLEAQEHLYLKAGAPRTWGNRLQS